MGRVVDPLPGESSRSGVGLEVVPGGGVGGVRYVFGNGFVQRLAEVIAGYVACFEFLDFAQDLKVQE